MSAVKTFEDYLSNQVPQVDLGNFLINLALSGLLATILAWAYSKYAKSQASRLSFASNFILTAMTTMLIISVVKSSLALSLGLVGALSIIRFRTAIKDPEELAFLFISISLGLGLGAEQRKITVCGFAIILLAFVLFKKKYQKPLNSLLMHLLFSWKASNEATKPLRIDEVFQDVQGASLRSFLKRVSETAAGSELSFLVEFSDIRQIDQLKQKLAEKYPSSRFNLIEYQGLVE